MTSVRIDIVERKLFVAQRLSAMILIPLVMIHLGLILYAVRGGLTGTEILQRTQGNSLWFLFYFVFVVAVAVHAPLGLRNILKEWSPLPGTLVNLICFITSAGFLLLGLRAVWAIF